jgi:hypothetical protein
MTMVGKRDGYWCVWGPKRSWWVRLLQWLGLVANPGELP